MPDRSAMNREAANARWEKVPADQRAGLGRQGYAGLRARLALRIPIEVTDPEQREVMLRGFVSEHMRGLARSGGRARAAQVAAAELRAAEAEERAERAEAALAKHLVSVVVTVDTSQAEAALWHASARLRELDAHEI